MKNLKVFISYSHKDTDLMKCFKNDFLKYKDKKIEFDAWDDSKLTTGYLWNKEILEKIKESQIAIFLISPNFLESRFCKSKELLRFYTEMRNGNAVLMPIIINVVSNKALNRELLSKIQFFRPKYETFNLPFIADNQVYCDSVIPYSKVSSLKIEELTKRYFQELNNDIKSSIDKQTEYKKSSDKISIEYGSLMAAIPNEMELEKPSFCQIYISYDEDDLNLIESEEEGELHYLEIKKQMEIILKTAPENYAHVDSNMPKTQIVEKGSFSEWSFNVIPKVQNDINIICIAGYEPKERTESQVDSNIKRYISYNEKVKVVRDSDAIQEGMKTQAKDTLIRTINYIPLPLGATENDKNSQKDRLNKNNNKTNTWFSADKLKYLIPSIIILVLGIIKINSIIDKTVPDVKPPIKEMYSLEIKLIPDVVVQDEVLIDIKDASNKTETLSTITFNAISNTKYEKDQIIELNLMSKNYLPYKNQVTIADSLQAIKLEFKYIDKIHGKILNENSESIHDATITVNDAQNIFRSDNEGKFEIDVLNNFGKYENLILYVQKQDYKSEIKSITTKESKNNLSIVLKNQIDSIEPKKPKTKKPPTEYNLGLNSPLKRPQILVNNKPIKGFNNGKEIYIKVPKGNHIISILDPSGIYSCDPINVDISGNMNLGFKCKNTIQTLELFFSNPELKGKLFQIEVFDIDGKRYKIMKDNSNIEKNIISIPRLPSGTHLFSFINSFCSQRFEINETTRSVTISCDFSPVIK